jgi:hypothetical protein
MDIIGILANEDFGGSFFFLYFEFEAEIFMTGSKDMKSSILP